MMKKIGLTPVFALLLAATLGLSQSMQVAQAMDCEDDSQYSEVTRDELNSLIQKKEAFVIDVNSQDSFAKRHIPTAIHYSSNKDKLEKVLPKKKDALIVAYCGGPQCTAWQMAAEEACEKGYTNVRHYKGGIKGWFDGRKS